MHILSWIGLILLLLVSGYGIFSYIRIQGLIRKSIALVQTAVPYQQAASEATSKALFIGDSTGVGVGATDAKLSLAGRFGADFPDWNIENLSVSGRKTAELITVLEGLPANSYQLVIVQIGGNDIVQFSRLPQLRTDIGTVLSKAKHLSPRVILITAGNVGNAPLLPRPLAFLWTWRTLAVRTLFMAEAKINDVIYVDLYKDRSDDPFALDPYRYHAADLFHPSAEGYGLWYQDFKKALE